MKKIRVLLLGGSGFIGTNLGLALLQKGFSVRVVSRSKPHSFLMSEGATWCKCDITDQRTLLHAMSDCEIVFHLASNTNPKTSGNNPASDVQNNIAGTLNVLEQAVAQPGIRRLIFISSGGTVYGIPKTLPISENHPTEPICSYGICKLSIEKYLALYHRNHNLDTRVLRLSNPYGTHQPIDRLQGAIAVFTARMLKGQPIEVWGDGSVTRDYLHVSDAVDAMLLLMEYQGDVRLFNLGSGIGHSINEILKILQIQAKKKIDVRYSEGRTFDVPVNFLDTNLIRRELLWDQKIDIDSGISRTISEFLPLL